MVFNGHQWVEPGHWILKDEGNFFSANVSDSFPIETAKLFPAKEYVTGYFGTWGKYL